MTIVFIKSFLSVNLTLLKVAWVLIDMQGFLARPQAGPGSKRWFRFVRAISAGIAHARKRPSVALNTLLPEVKLRQFALEAKSLDAGRMLEMAPAKRYTLAATLIELQNARMLDDLTEMFIKRLMRIHRHGREALALDRLKHQERTDGLIHTLHAVILAWSAEGDAEQRLKAIDAALAPNSRVLLELCEAHQAQAGNSYYPYLWRFYQSHRSTLLRIWRVLRFRSTTHDTSLDNALAFVLANETIRTEWVSLPESWNHLDWIPDTWWPMVTDAAKRGPVNRVHRRSFELCVFTQMMWDLKSGDAAIEGSRDYAVIVSNSSARPKLPN